MPGVDGAAQTGLVEELFIAAVGPLDPTVEVWFRNYSVASPLSIRSQLDADPESVVWGEDQASFCVRTTNNSYYIFTIPRSVGTVFPAQVVPTATLFGINPIRPSTHTVVASQQTKRSDSTSYCIPYPETGALQITTSNTSQSVTSTVGDFTPLALMSDVRYALNADKHLILFITIDGLVNLFDDNENHAMIYDASSKNILFTTFDRSLTMVRTTFGAIHFNTATSSDCSLSPLSGTAALASAITYTFQSGQTTSLNTGWLTSILPFIIGTEYEYTQSQTTAFRKANVLTPDDQCEWIFKTTGNTAITDPGPWTYEVRVSSEEFPTGTGGLYPICATNPNVAWLLVVRRHRTNGGSTQWQTGVFYVRSSGQTVLSAWTMRDFATDALGDFVKVLTANQNHALWFIYRASGTHEIYLTWLKDPETAHLVGDNLATFRANYWRLISGPVDRPQDLLWLGADPGAGTFIDGWEPSGAATLISVPGGGYPLIAQDPTYAQLISLPSTVTPPVLPAETVNP